MYTIEEFDEQKTKVMKYIVFKKRTEYEVRTKFTNVIQEDLLEDIIEYLKEAKYIDDKEYIEKVVNNFMQLKNLSLKELKYKLISKGLNKNDIEDYFYENRDELYEYELKSALNIIYKKKNLEETEIKQFLQKKGYMLDNINLAIEKSNKF